MLLELTFLESSEGNDRKVSASSNPSSSASIALGHFGSVLVSKFFRPLSGNYRISRHPDALEQTRKPLLFLVRHMDTGIYKSEVDMSYI
jgi:hypothetical protein